MDKNFRAGLMYGLAAYCLWGFLPIYWKQLHDVPAMEILASRFIWSLVFVALLQLCTGKLGTFVKETRQVFSTWKSGLMMIGAALLITINWGVFIWAVEDGRIIETSLGYYITPLFSVLVGVVLLGERLTKEQIIAVLCAGIGITILVVKTGSLPWVSVGLFVSFTFYGLLKKLLKQVSPFTSIMIETALISPFALYYLFSLAQNGQSSYVGASWVRLCYLVGAGAATATPLLLFTASAKLLPLNIVGFLQYLSPSISMLLGIFLYGENFTPTMMMAFGCIWVGLSIFTYGQLSTNK